MEILKIVEEDHGRIEGTETVNEVVEEEGAVVAFTMTETIITAKAKKGFTLSQTPMETYRLVIFVTMPAVHVPAHLLVSSVNHILLVHRRANVSSHKATEYTNRLI